MGWRPGTGLRAVPHDVVGEAQGALGRGEAREVVAALRADHMRPAGAIAVTITVSNFKGGVAIFLAAAWKLLTRLGRARWPSP